MCVDIVFFCFLLLFNAAFVRLFFHSGVTVFVESAYNTSLVEGRIRDYMTKHVSAFLKNMTEETFGQHLTALITKKRTKPKSVYESGDR